MFKNYIKTAIRQLWKHKLFSSLNIFGLAISMAICLLLIMMMVDQYSYDNFHANGDRIYRVVTGQNAKGAPINRPTNARTALSIAEPLEDNYPFIEYTVPLAGIDGGLKKQNSQTMIGSEGYAVDEHFSKVFSFPLTEGNPEEALKEPYSIVLTQSLIEKLYPDGNALGKSLQFEHLGLFKVTGVMPDPPIRSHIRFDFLMSYATITSLSKEQQKSIGIYSFDDTWRALVYVLLKDNNDKDQLAAALENEAQGLSARNETDHFLLEAQPLTKVMPGRGLSNEIGIATPQEVLFFLIALGIIIILSACFNYMNLSLARSLKRAKEIGIRKVNGAGKKQIIIQFLGEAIILSLLALVMAIGLLEFLIPKFYSLDPFVEEVFALEKSVGLYAIFLGFSLLVGLMAGLFPAFNISSFKPIQSIKQLDHIKLSSKMGIRKLLIVFQFSLSMIFVLAVLIVLKQQKHVLNADLGMKTKDLLYVEMQEQDFDLFRQQIEQIPGVQGVSGSNIVLMTGENSSSQVIFKNNTDSMKLRYVSGTPNYLANMDIQLVAGEAFPTNSNSQGEQFIIINEKASQRMGFENPVEALGKTLIVDSNALSVIGVTENFHYDQIWFEPIQSFAIRQADIPIRTANIQLSGQDNEATQKAIVAAWENLFPDVPHYGFFLEDRIYFLDKFFRMGSQIIGFVGFLTIIISCMGLLGMVIYHIEGRIKEVGIRKVLGASVKGIIWHLSKGFLILMLISMIIAVPVCILAGNMWLQNFYLRIQIGPMIVLSGIAMILIIGALTVLSQTYVAAQSDPVDSLRSD